ncbi:MAG: phosphatase PAP2 family protein [Thermomicrobiaceae bacterium]
MSRVPASSQGIEKRLSTIPMLVISATLYGLLAMIIRRWPVTRTDLHVTQTLQANHHPELERVLSFVSWFGFRPQSLLLPFGVIGTFWGIGRRLEAVLLFAGWWSSMLSYLTKQLIRRPRPDATVVRVVVAKIRDTSFPSGHVVHYVTFWGMVAYLLGFRSRSPLARWFGRLVIVPILALVGPSRIYLGHHWFTDVLGSYLLGSAYLAGLIEAHSLLRQDENEQMRSPNGWRAGASQWLQ